MTQDPVEIKEQRSLVAGALDTLNADQRAALVLVDMEGYSVEDAAQILGCAPGTVKSLCAPRPGTVAAAAQPPRAGGGRSLDASPA
jgi:DNA-directed RNA polymerase specialized sigma24 family protein